MFVDRNDLVNLKIGQLLHLTNFTKQFEGLGEFKEKIDNIVRFNTIEIFNGDSKYKTFSVDINQPDNGCTFNLSKFCIGDIVQSAAKYNFKVDRIDLAMSNEFMIIDVASNRYKESELTFSSYASVDNKKVACEHPRAYINVISASLKFKVCPDCKREL